MERRDGGLHPDLPRPRPQHGILSAGELALAEADERDDAGSADHVLADTSVQLIAVVSEGDQRTREKRMRGWAYILFMEARSL